MARTRKKTETAPNQDTLSAADAGPLSEKPVVVTERHRVVREWSENKAVEEDQFDDDDDDDIETVVEEVAELDPIALVAQEMASSQHNWTLRVDRLPEYETTGKSGVGFRKFCGFVTIPSAEWLRDQCYLEEIQSRWARAGECNSFAICIRKGSVIFRYLPIVSVEPAPATSLPGLNGVPVDGSTINVYGAQQSSTDVMDGFMKQFEKFQKFQNSMLPPWMKNYDPTQLQTAAPGSSQPLTGKALLLQALADDDSIVGDMKTIFRKLNGESESKGLWDAVTAFIESPILPSMIAKVSSQPSAQTANNQPQTEASPQPDVVAYQRLLSVLINCARVNGDVTPALQAIDGFVALFPEHAGQVDGFLNAPTEIIFPMLAQSSPMAAEVVAMPHAADWFGKLKTAYFDNGENEEPK